MMDHDDLEGTPGGAEAADALGGEAAAPMRERISRVLRQLVEDAHRKNAALPIVGPDHLGAFPDSGARAWGLIDGGVPAIVADANELRGEVIRTCRHGRTILVTAANVGALRIYLASHVVGELAEHGERWAIEAGISPTAFRDCWQRDYLPLARVIADEELRLDLLSPSERDRVEALVEADSDDVPSAILALSLGAFFVSHDRAALRAVYGPGIDIEAHRDWLEVLRSSGEAGELGKLVLVSAITPTALVAGALEGGRWISRRLGPWALLPLALGGALLAHERISGESWRRMWSGFGELAVAFTDLYLRYLHAHQTFAAAAATSPNWAELIRCNPAEDVVTRACMRALAATPAATRSATELAEEELRRLGVEVEAATIDRVLGMSGCFRPLAEGAWQLAHPADARLIVGEPVGLSA
jgi:predicted nucleic acid-binding protein